MLTIVFSLCSLFFAGINDLIFKRYGRKPRSVGALVALIGMVWTIFFLGMGFVKGGLSFTPLTWLVGGGAGAASAIANILLIEAMKKTGAGLAATVYRLNLVFVVVLAFLFLHESFNGWKLAGLGVAVAAIVLMFKSHHEAPGQFPAVKYLFLLVLASFLRAGMGIGYKIASLCHIQDESFLVLNGLAWMIFGSVYMGKKDLVGVVHTGIIAYAVLSGLMVCGIVLFMKLAVNYGDASVAITISQFSFLITFPMSVILFHEHCSLKKIVAVLLAVVCIILLAIGA